MSGEPKCWKGCSARARAVLAVALATLLLSPVGAFALTPETSYIVRVDVSKDLGPGFGVQTGSYEVPFPVAAPDGSYSWSLDLGSTIPVYSTQNSILLATFDGLNVTFNQDPGVGLGFSLSAGLSGADVTVTAGTASFPLLGSPDAYATATGTLTDAYNGATILGRQPGQKIYQARYNTTGVWANLVASASVEAENSIFLPTETWPATGMLPVGTGVDRVSAQFSFSLTPEDQASGSSYFKVVPEPATLCLLALGGLVLGRRRK
jgi:hypothetical protein